MCQLSALSRSLLRTLWRNGRALERELEIAACAQESPAVARIALREVYYRNLLQPICAVPSPAWSVRFSNMSPFCDAQIQSKISRSEGDGKNPAHQLLQMLGERLIMERCALGKHTYSEVQEAEHMLQDVGFSVIRDIGARTELLLQIRQFTQQQSLEASALAAATTTISTATTTSAASGNRTSVPYKRSMSLGSTTTPE